MPYEAQRTLHIQHWLAQVRVVSASQALTGPTTRSILRARARARFSPRKTKVTTQQPCTSEYEASQNLSARKLACQGHPEQPNAR